MRAAGMEDVGTGDGDASMPGLPPPHLPVCTPELGGCPQPVPNSAFAHAASHPPREGVGERGGHLGARWVFPASSAEVGLGLEAGRRMVTGWLLRGEEAA